MGTRIVAVSSLRCGGEVRKRGGEACDSWGGLGRRARGRRRSDDALEARALPREVRDLAAAGARLLLLREADPAECLGVVPLLPFDDAEREVALHGEVVPRLV